MRSRWLSAALGLGFGSVALLACGPENDIVDPNPPAQQPDSWTFQPEVFVADAAFRASVETHEGYLAVPFRGHETLDQELTVGRILFGDRAPAMAANNPAGFMRKVTGTPRRDGDAWHVPTEDAFLEDVFGQASLHSSGAFDRALYELSQGIEPKAGDLQLQDESKIGEPYTLTNRWGFSGLELAGGVNPVPDGAGPTGGAELSAKASYLSEDTLTLRPTIKVDYVGGGWFSSPSLMFDVKLPWQRVERTCWSVEGQFKAEAGATSGNLADKFKDKVKTFFKKQLPFASLGPVPLTVELEVKGVCSAYATGGVQVNTVTTSSGEGLSGRYGWNGGGFETNVAQPTAPQSNTERTITTAGGGGVQCEAPIRISILVGGTFGGFGQMVPGFEAKAGGGKVSQNGTDVGGSKCLEANFTNKFEVGLSLTLSEHFGLAFEARTQIGPNFSVPLVKPEVGCSGTTDSCGGRDDGWYCSVTNPKHGIRCANKTTAEGSDCAGETYCQTQDSNDPAGKAKLAGAVPECGGTKPTRTVPSLACK